ncbi:autotransporter outer membrane beta-barrel domain-containing protein [Aureimonas sp. Leaf324]|jgi:hypothetical protein|uniref:autotransporter outer membrane beta-barrel domain-containing protein n=1 Tax=Aureimonas sp. Leaf324 TaxID=1736336 RepID=UPI0006F8CBB9|nr:autotransporter outer membrane beta-barrel domain-containing protein [Aureimonas sp. Leaf324]KQQ81886.1 hypothetical protein ASF65_07450 [Aureimonas sp. Leaf324]
MPVLRPRKRRGLTLAALAALFLVAVPETRAATLEDSLRSASDLALAAAARLNARVEAVRDPGITAMSGLDLDFRIDRTQVDRTLDPFLDAPQPDLPTLFWDNDFDGRPTPSSELEVSRRLTSDGSGDVWGSGVVEFGREADGMIAARRSRADIATGLDVSLSVRATAGAALGLNRASIDGAGSLDLPTLSTYGTFAPTPDSYLDLTAGAGPLRTSATGAGQPIASGEAGFATATYGSRFAVGPLTLSPYARMESAVVRALPRDGAWSGALLASRTSAVTGVKTSRVIRRQGATIAPALRLEMRQDIARARPLGRRVSQELTIAPEIEAELAPHWTARLEHRSRFGGDGDTRSLQIRLETTF